jgi:hypothetical protein
MMMQKMNGFLRFLMAVFFLFCFVPSSFSATVDVMIVYDSTAKSWVDSNGGINAFAADAVARMNQATANSGVSLTFRLAHAAVVSYTYSGDLGTDLNRLTAGSSTYNMDVVHTWRDTYGADLVVMLVDTGSDYGTVGIGWLLTSTGGQSNYAYSVCAIQSVADSNTMTHEVGHNFGCDHAKHMLPASAAGPGIFSYSAGWYFTGTNSTKYCTIMAYNSDGYGNTYVEAPYFSSPLVSYQGTLTGDAADGDNARTLRNTMDVVAAYRTASSNDSTPDQFTFTDQTNVALSTVITSNTITVTGINTATTISITGGEYSINGGSYTSSSGTVNNGNTVTVQLTSSGSNSTTTNATLTIGGVSDTFSVTTWAAPPPPDTTPDQFTFTDQTNVALSTVITSNTITVTGINTAATISITGGEYSINGGSYTSSSSTVNNGNTVKVRQTSSGSYSTKTDTILTIGGVSDTFSVTTWATPPPPDTTPAQFTFTDQTNVALNTTITSNTIIVSGVNTATTISITGGTYSIKGRSYTSSSGTVSNGDTVTVQLTSSGNYSTTTNATLTIGGISDTFSVTTQSATSDMTPDQFTLTDQTNATLSTVITSNTITVSGINTAAPISITGGTYSINGGSYTSASGTVSNSNTVTVKLTSSGNYSTTTNATLTIGGISDTFSVTTQSAPSDMTPNQFTFTDQTDAALSTAITSNTITVSGITSTTPISITGGTYSINGGSYTSADGTVNPDDTVTVQQTSSGNHSTTTDATLTIGGISDTFSVTTISSSSGGGGESGGGGGCFIATAAFGSPLAGQVEILRQFRDRYLLTNAPGQKFVAWYYRNGPAAANYIKDKPLIKAAVRMTLYPLIGFSLLLISGYLPFVTIGLLLSALLFLRFRPKKLSAM